MKLVGSPERIRVLLEQLQKRGREYAELSAHQAALIVEAFALGAPLSVLVETAQLPSQRITSIVNAAPPIEFADQPIPTEAEVLLALEVAVQGVDEAAAHRTAVLLDAYDLGVGVDDVAAAASMRLSGALQRMRAAVATRDGSRLRAGVLETDTSGDEGEPDLPGRREVVLRRFVEAEQEVERASQAQWRAAAALPRAGVSRATAEQRLGVPRSKIALWARKGDALQFGELDEAAVRARLAVVFEELQQMLPRLRRASERCQGLVMRAKAAGMPPARVASTMGVDPDDVARWLRGGARLRMTESGTKQRPGPLVVDIDELVSHPELLLDLISRGRTVRLQRGGADVAEIKPAT